MDLDAIDTGNPVDDLLAAVRMVKAATGAKVDRIALAPWVAPAMVQNLRGAKRRAEQTLRRNLSCRYDKRRRQKLNGVAARLALRKRLARITLRDIDQHIADWERMIPAATPQ